MTYGTRLWNTATTISVVAVFHNHLYICVYSFAQITNDSMCNIACLLLSMWMVSVCMGKLGQTNVHL